jgi:hypothetical protein
MFVIVMKIISKLVTLSLSILMMNALVGYSKADMSIATNPVVYVSPETYEAEELGQNFVIQVRIDSVTGLTGYELRLRFNTTLLESLGATIGSIFPPPPRSTYTIYIDNTQGIISVNSSLAQGETPANGSGTLLSVTFNATRGTPWPQPRESCPLQVTDDILRGTGTPPQVISHDTINGLYKSPYLPPTLNLTVNTDKNEYFFEEKATISGSLTGNGYEVIESFVALEVDTPYNLPYAVRTFPMSSLPLTAPVTITELTPCSSDGTPKSSFPVNTMAYFKVTITNNAATSLDLKVIINPYDSSNASLGVVSNSVAVNSGNTLIAILSFPLERSAKSGPAFVYANVLSDFVKNGGLTLAREKGAAFTITGSTQGNPVYLPLQPQGTYKTYFKMHYRAYFTGNYTIYASAEFMDQTATQNKIIKIELGGDVNKDGYVNLTDLVLLANAYASIPGDPKWNPACDINKDGIVNLPDLVILAQNYGSGPPP